MSNIKIKNQYEEFGSFYPNTTRQKAIEYGCVAIVMAGSQKGISILKNSFKVEKKDGGYLVTVKAKII